MMQGTSVVDGVVGMREITIYVCWHRVLDDGVNGLITFVDRSTKCIRILQSMGIADILKCWRRKWRRV